MSQPIKCLVWDLDQTLWRGVLLEDEEVTVDARIREVVVELDRRGILQSVASRNDHEHAWELLEKLGLAEYFVLPQIGWGRKSDSVRAIADGLAFAYGTIAFIDDQAAEWAEVNHYLPEVRCYPAEAAATLVDLPEFTPPTVTEDSSRRRLMYQAGQRREAERTTFTGTDDDFLRTLDLRLGIKRATEADIARVEELTRRTSQMNATGVHYSDATLRRLLADLGHEVLVATLEDRFGPHGAVGIMLVAKHAAVWHLKLIATSCRVVSFGVGSVLLRWLIDQNALNGAHLLADFRPTGRNRIMEIALRLAGFAEADCACRAALAPDDTVQRLHLTTERQPAPTTMRVLTPVLSAATPTVTEWAA